MSKVFHIPDMKGFIDTFNKDPTISSSSVYNAIKESFGADIDLEVLMTVLEDLGRSQSDLLKRISPQTTDFLLRRYEERSLYLDDEKVKIGSTGLVKRIKKIIVDSCLLADSQNQERIMQVYDSFFEKISGYGSRGLSGDTRVNFPHGIKICTTNYDRCLESYLGRRQIDFTSGIRQQYGHSVFDVSIFGGPATELLKLHGSIDLFNIEGMIRQRRHGESTGEEVVYYPIEFGGYNHVIESPYLELFYHFRHRLSTEGLWVIIGSSLRDRTICSVMNDVIRLKPQLQQPRVLFVNPEGAIFNRLKEWGFPHLRNRLNHVPSQFGTEGANVAILNALREQS